MALPHYRATGDFRGWLRRIARNHCHDLWRAQHGRGVTEVPSDVHAVHLDDAATATTDPAAGVADRLAVRALLRRLRRRDATLLVEHHSLGVPVRALAQQWNLTRGAMEVALHRARQRARRLARDEGLRAVLPLAVCRRLGSWWHHGTHPGLAMSNLGEAFYVGIAVVMVVTAPSSTPQPDREARGTARVAATAHSVADPAPDHVLGDARHRSGRADPPRDPSRNPRRRATPGTAAADPPALRDARPVAVPGVQRTISSAASGRTGGGWGVRPPDDTGASIVVRGDEPKPLVKVYDTACEKTSPDDPLMFCEDG